MADLFAPDQSNQSKVPAPQIQSARQEIPVASGSSEVGEFSLPELGPAVISREARMGDFLVKITEHSDAIPLLAKDTPADPTVLSSLDTALELRYPFVFPVQESLKNILKYAKENSSTLYNLINEINKILDFIENNFLKIKYQEENKDDSMSGAFLFATADTFLDPNEFKEQINRYIVDCYGKNSDFHQEDAPLMNLFQSLLSVAQIEVPLQSMPPLEGQRECLSLEEIARFKEALQASAQCMSERRKADGFIPAFLETLETYRWEKWSIGVYMHILLGGFFDLANTKEDNEKEFWLKECEKVLNSLNFEGIYPKELDAFNRNLHYVREDNRDPKRMMRGMSTRIVKVWNFGYQLKSPGEKRVLQKADVTIQDLVDESSI